MIHGYILVNIDQSVLSLLLILRMLNMFLAMIPISKTGGFATDTLAIIHFLNLASFKSILSTSSSNLLTAWKVSKWFVGLKYVFQQVTCLTNPRDYMGGITETPNYMDSEGLRLINRTLKFPPYSIYIGQRVPEKPSTFLVIFFGLWLKPITLGMHSYVCWSQMSQIWGIN